MFVVRRNVKTLSYLRMRRRFFAKNGLPGAGRKRDGAAGADAIIEVPPGTVVTDTETGERLADLTDENDRAVILRGGRGGKGNTHFKSSRLQTPRFAQPGEEGEERRLRVEIRIIADVGFVGLPNAGKSTLLGALTAADPKVGNYPFTTVIPNLGVMRLYDEHDVVLADIPGIIEGAGEGAGLGLRFLKHIARSAGLAFVIEPLEGDPAHAYNTLLGELADYDRSLLDKPRVLILTKADLLTDETERRDRVRTLQGAGPATPEGTNAPDGDPPVIAVSAHTGEGMDHLRRALLDLMWEGRRREEDARREEGPRGDDAE